MIKLSKRLEAIYAMIPKNSVVVDVGTDHGWLIIKAILTGKAPSAYGLDIADGPLMQARSNIKQFGLESSIVLMKQDGLSEFKYDADVFVIAGMGAETIWYIISQYEFSRQQEVIVQANTHNPWLRKMLVEHGYKIIEECFVLDRNKPVFIIKIRVGEQTLSNVELILGPYLMVQTNSEYRVYLRNRRNHLVSISQFKADVMEEIEIIDNFLNEGA